ncbi:MAG: hypothetical protein WCF04_10180 [Candidatus Nanopelagicales bacterium]
MARTGVLGDRFLEILAVVLLGVATVGTAWCALQSALWNGQQDDLALAASNQRVEASRLYGLATQTLAYDSNLVGQYAQAVLAEDERSQKFYREVLMRPALLPFLDTWQAEIESGGEPPNLVTDEQYLDSLQGDFLAAEEETERLTTEAADAGRTGDSYVLTTVLLAISLFFAGVTSSFRYPAVRTALLVGCSLAIGLAAVQIIDLPIAEESGALIPRL